MADITDTSPKDLNDRDSCTSDSETPPPFTFINDTSPMQSKDPQRRRFVRTLVMKKVSWERRQKHVLEKSRVSPFPIGRSNQAHRPACYCTCPGGPRTYGILKMTDLSQPLSNECVDCGGVSNVGTSRSSAQGGASECIRQEHTGREDASFPPLLSSNNLFGSGRLDPFVRWPIEMRPYMYGLIDHCTLTLLEPDHL
jgi:hypothetical protein